MYKYLIYNTIVQSDFKLYNLCQTDGTPDVHIKLGNIDFARIPDKNKSFYYSTNFVYLESQYAFYSIDSGKERRNNK